MSHLSRPAIAILVSAFAVACSEGPVAVDAIDARSTSMQASVSGSPGDLAAMQHIVNTFDQAWNAGNGAAYAAQYGSVIEWVGPNGNVLTDPAAITGTYAFLLSVVFPGSTRQSTIRRVTFLTGTLAVLDIDARVTNFPPPPPGIVPWQPGIIRVLERNVVQKRAGEWRIILHQQTTVAPGIGI